MVDFVHLSPFPARFAQPLRAAVSGTSAVWPQSITAEEQQVIEVHGMLPIVYEISRMASLRGPAIAAAAVQALRLADLREVLVALELHGVLPLIVQGTALAYSDYS